MDLKAELKELREKQFITYADMAELIKVKPTSFYQWIYGNTTLAKNKQKALENFVNRQKGRYYEQLL